MSQTIEVKVPDIGDFKDVAVIEILVKPGDRVEAETGLVTLESDKATMDIPSPAAGVVREVKVKVGDKVAEGSAILSLESGEAASAAPPPRPSKGEGSAPRPSAFQGEGKGGGGAAGKPAPARSAAAHAGAADLQCDVVVLGSGPGGYSAAFRAADLGLATVLVERYATLGGVCLNVGCIPSKALLHVAAVTDEARNLAAHGIAFGEPRIDLEKLRAWRTKVVGKLTGGLASMAKARKVTVVQGVGAFAGPNHLAVETANGRKVIAFGHAIIAAGSQAARLPLLPDDPRIVDSTGALELPSLPKRLLVIGGGIIGLEMGTVYSTLGARLDVVEMLDGLMTGADRDLVAVWQKFNARRFDNVMLKTKAAKVEATGAGLRVWFEGGQASAEPQVYDMILVSVGRTPNGRNIGADAAGVAVDERGFIPVDRQMRTNVPHIFAIGDIAGPPMLAHKAVHEGHVAAEAAAGQKSFFDARVIPSVAYTDPEIAWAGVTEEEARKQGLKHRTAKFPWAASGRAIANGRDEGFTKLIFDEQTHRIIGGGIVGTGAGDLVSEIALAIEMGADAVDIGKTIHPHPTTSESIGMAAELYEGVCTDLPPPRKR
ncbi:MAG: dihydrolipoyl dehydrogenase [Burkholderiales bacterium]|nr:dihydrolipoyl dehydrogenase [Burkholderiales bacterium]